MARNVIQLVDQSHSGIEKYGRRGLELAGLPASDVERGPQGTKRRTCTRGGAGTPNSSARISWRLARGDQGWATKAGRYSARAGPYHWTRWLDGVPNAAAAH
jgi:hypothetical protein